MFTAASSVLNDVASISSGVTTTILDGVLAVDDTILLYRDQVKVWRHAKQAELTALGLTPTESVSSTEPAITITSEPG